MKVKIMFLLLLLGSLCLAQVNGIREEIEPGRIKLRVWGTHEERGYAYGYLLAEESVTLFEEYVFDHMFYGNAQAYSQARSLFTANWVIDSDYLTEFASALAGVEAAGSSIYISALNRNLDEYDIAMINSVVDMMVFTRRYGIEIADPWGCATLSSWDSATEDDPLLQGDLLITRHLDWDNGGILDDYPLLLICQPSEADEQPFITFTYPLFVTGLSATNESGLTCFMDVGSNDTIVNNGPYVPVLLRMRKALESLDLDGSGNCDTQDMVSIMNESNIAATAIITTVSGDGSQPLIIEKNNAGQAVRTKANNNLVPAVIGDNLVATNHFRVLYDPVYCQRYTSLAYEIEGDSDFNSDRQWQVLGESAGQGTWTRMTIQIAPRMQECLWAATYGNTPAYDCQVNRIDLYQEFHGWQNIPPHTTSSGTALLFLNDGLSYEELNILSEISAFCDNWGDNAVQPVVFLGEMSSFCIPEYQDLCGYFGVTEPLEILYNGISGWTGNVYEIEDQLLNTALPENKIKLKICKLNQEEETIAYSIENLGIEETVNYQIAATYLRQNNSAGTADLAENWDLLDGVWELPSPGNREVHTLNLTTPQNGWEGIQVMLSIVDLSEMIILQSAVCDWIDPNPLGICYDGERQIAFSGERHTAELDTVTFFNNGESLMEVSVSFELSELPPDVIAAGHVMSADGIESEILLSEELQFELLAEEYLYLQPVFSEISDNTGFHFNMQITSEQLPQCQQEIPFEINVNTGIGDETVSPAPCLLANYPNPFNPATVICYELPDKVFASLIIYNIKGQEIDRIKNLRGKGKVSWEPDEPGSGIYLYCFDKPGSPVKKMILLK